MTKDKYNVVWIDDEFQFLENGTEEEQTDIKILKLFFKQHGIHCKGFSNFEEGLQEIEQNLVHYDAVILDAQCFKVKGQERGTEDIDNGLLDAIKKIESLKSKKCLPYFVFSGQIDKEIHGGVKKVVGKHYAKSSPAAKQELIGDLKKATNEQPETQAKHKHPQIIDLCQGGYLGADLYQAILAMAMDLSRDEIKSDFNAIRKVIERVFLVLNQNGLLPDEVHQGSGSINKSMRFLCDEHRDYKHHDEILHPTAAFLLKNMLNVCQDGSHLEGENLVLKVSDFVNTVKSSYLIKSTIYQLFDFLLFFKSIIDEGTDKSTNMQKWNKEPNWIEGEIEELKANRGIFKPQKLPIAKTARKVDIPKSILNSKGIAKGDNVKLTVKFEVDKIEKV